MNNALANRVDAVQQRVDALRPRSAPPRKVPGAGGEGGAKQLQYELAMTSKVFSSAQDQLEVERRRTRDAKAREERALVAAEVARLEAEVSVTEADGKRESSERQLAQLLNEQRAQLELELQEAQKLNEEQLAAERAEREELAERTAELEEQIAEVESLRRERDEARAETQHFIDAAGEKHFEELERLRMELSGSVEERAAAHAESERLKRAEQMAKKAVGRIANQGLTRGWSGWHEQWMAAARQKRMLAAAGARLARPALAAAVAHWRVDWQGVAAKHAASAAKSTTQLLEEANNTRKRLDARIARMEEEHAAHLANTLKAAADQKTAALERLRMELTGSVEQQAAARAEADKEARIETLHKKAAARIGNQGLMRGWSGWHEKWEQAATEKRMLAAAGSRLRRPALTASFGHWRTDWQGEATMGLAQQLEVGKARIKAFEARLERLRDEARADAEVQMSAVKKKHETELERLRIELTGSVEQQAAARAEADKEKRVEQLHKKAAARIGNQGLMRGWSGWHEKWSDAAREKRMLAAAGARIARPGLAAAVAHWRADWQGEGVKAAKGTFEQRLKESERQQKKHQERCRGLELEVTELNAEIARQLAVATEKQKAALVRLRTELTGSVEEQVAARAEAQKEARVEQLHKKAAARIGNQGLMRGWSGWHDKWSDAAREKRMLAAAGARIAKPGLAAAVAHWRADWQGDAAARRVLSAKEASKGHKQLYEESREQARQLQEELAASKLRQKQAAKQLQEYEAEREAAVKRNRSLERQLAGQPEPGNFEAQQAAHDEAAKQKRVEELARKAMRRIGNQAILRGWTAWQGGWEEKQRNLRMLKHATAKLLQPKLVACFGRMYRLHVAMTHADVSKGQRSALQEAQYQVGLLREELAAAREEATMLKGGASVEEETARRMAEDKEQRVARVQHTALKRLMQQQLGKGFYSWQQEVLEQNRRLRLLRQAGNRLGKPKLASGFMFWASEAARLRHEAGAKVTEKGHVADMRRLRTELEARMREERRVANEARRVLDEAVRSLQRQLEEYGFNADAPPADPQFIVIHDIAANGVPNGDRAGASDPYARFSLLLDNEVPKKDAVYTSYMVSETNPVWEGQRLQLKIAAEDPRPLTMRVEVRHADTHPLTSHLLLPFSLHPPPLLQPRPRLHPRPHHA